MKDTKTRAEGLVEIYEADPCSTAYDDPRHMENVAEQFDGLTVMKTGYRATFDEVLILVEHYAKEALQMEFDFVTDGYDQEVVRQLLFPRRRVEDFVEVVGRAEVDRVRGEVWKKFESQVRTARVAGLRLLRALTSRAVAREAEDEPHHVFRHRQ